MTPGKLPAVRNWNVMFDHDRPDDEGIDTDDDEELSIVPAANGTGWQDCRRN